MALEPEFDKPDDHSLFLQVSLSNEILRQFTPFPEVKKNKVPFDCGRLPNPQRSFSQIILNVKMCNILRNFAKLNFVEYKFYKTIQLKPHKNIL